VVPPPPGDEVDGAPLEAGLRMGIGPMDLHADMDRLRSARPGFDDLAPADSVGWGYLLHR